MSVLPVCAVKQVDRIEARRIVATVTDFAYRLTSVRFGERNPVYVDGATVDAGLAVAVRALGVRPFQAAVAR